MTCLTPSVYRSDHIHFLDGAAGGRGLDERKEGPSYHEPLSRVAGLAEPLFVASREFVTDSPLEGDGFELLVRGRGEVGCRAL